MDERDRSHRPAAAISLSDALPVASGGGPGARVVRYLAGLTRPRIVLWCYLIWYGFVLLRYFDPSPSLWLSSLGISAIIGTGLYLSTAHGGQSRTALEPWQIIRLYMMPFCVSSFAALIKGRGFWLVLDPSLGADAVALGGCALFVAAAALARRLRG